MAARQTIAVLGTGTMGAPIAHNLATAGFSVRAWNRSREKAEPLADVGAQICDSPGEAVKGADCFLTMLADADAVESTVLDDSGPLDDPAPDLLWLQCSTVGVEAADRFAHLAAERGVAFVDAPVLGSRKPAEDRALVVLASGPEDLHERCHPVFEAIGIRTLWVGDAGAGSRLKLVVNNWVLSIVGSVSESVALAEALGLDPRRFLEAIDGSPTDSPYAHLKGKAMIEGDFTPSFPTAGARKDAGLIVEAMHGSGMAGEMAEALLHKFEQTIDQGHGADDMAAVLLHSRGKNSDGR